MMILQEAIQLLCSQILNFHCNLLILGEVMAGLKTFNPVKSAKELAKLVWEGSKGASLSTLSGQQFYSCSYWKLKNRR